MLVEIVVAAVLPPTFPAGVSSAMVIEPLEETVAAPPVDATALLPLCPKGTLSCVSFSFLFSFSFRFRHRNRVRSRQVVTGNRGWPRRTVAPFGLVRMDERYGDDRYDPRRTAVGAWQRTA